MNTCPHCGSGPLQLNRSITAKPIGTFSLAGAQMKVSAVDQHILSCAACGWYAVGDVEGVEATADGTITGGHFQAREVSAPPAQSTAEDGS